MADDHYSSKRKYDDPSPPPRRTGFSSGPPPTSPPGGGAPSYNSVPPPPDEIQLAKQRAQEIAARIFNAAEAKRPRVDNGDDDVGGFGGGGSLGGSGGGGRIGGGGLGFSSSAGGGHGASIPPLSSQSSAPQYSYGGYQGTSKKIEIPNGRVGVIIGKAGETIRYIQLQSGAKIQVTRDHEAEPGAPTRPVELSGNPEQISKAEQLIKEVLAEVLLVMLTAFCLDLHFFSYMLQCLILQSRPDAGSSGAGSGRKYNAPQPGGETFQMKIANNKVGLVIGKGGETIKSMQLKSGARIQVIPLHLPAGDTSTERTVHIDGTPEQIESAKQLVIEVTSENRARNPMSGGYSQQGYRPQSNWGPPSVPPQQPGYGYMQPGAYPGAPPQYGAPQQPYGSYPPTSGGYQTGWDQSQNQQSHTTPPGTGYDYYSQQQQPQQQQSAPGTAASTDATSYNYGQPSTYASQGYDSTYTQQSGGQQAYGHDGYSGYQTQGQQQGYSQQTGYDQQGYGASAYGSAANSTQDGSAPSYGGPGGTNQASPGQQTSTPAAGSHPGYASQPPTSAAASYPAQGSAPSGYGAPPPQSGYGAQPPQQGGYGQGAYGQPSPQGQKPLASSPYGQAPPPGSAQGGYGQYGYSQPAYGAPPAYPGAPPASHPGYGQQQSYGDAYGSGSYGQPPAYSTEATAAAASQDHSTAPAAGPGTTAAPAPDNSGRAQTSAET
ncbi:uncharacterized protein [Miscanthus floridulus]|uniref:uncharacterized protein n=1 Tax=Miscanthus floridulus TaxID=154761 RepID=UPI003457F440